MDLENFKINLCNDIKCIIEQYSKVLEQVITLESKRNKILSTIDNIDEKLYDNDLVQIKTNVENIVIKNLPSELKNNLSEEKHQMKKRKM